VWAGKRSLAFISEQKFFDVIPVMADQALASGTLRSADDQALIRSEYV